MKQNYSEDKNKFYEALKKSQPEDFDGHTIFSKLTPSQRLDWLQTAIQTYAELKKISEKEIKDTYSTKNKFPE
ncbi:MAG: hypothetical protein QXH80_02690 [Candidatus Nanoarchaeia archaeon]